jgi:hypothetical protein
MTLQRDGYHHGVDSYYIQATFSDLRPDRAFTVT